MYHSISHIQTMQTDLITSVKSLVFHFKFSLSNKAALCLVGAGQKVKKRGSLFMFVRPSCLLEDMVSMLPLTAFAPLFFWSHIWSSPCGWKRHCSYDSRLGFLLAAEPSPELQCVRTIPVRGFCPPPLALPKTIPGNEWISSMHWLSHRPGIHQQLRLKSLNILLITFFIKRLPVARCNESIPLISARGGKKNRN